MANEKILKTVGITGWTVYVIVRRDSDDYYLDAAGSFVDSIPSPLPALTEDTDIAGLYNYSTSAEVWDDGSYTVIFKKQSGGSQAPATDIVCGYGSLNISLDQEVQPVPDIIDFEGVGI